MRFVQAIMLVLGGGAVAVLIALALQRIQDPAYDERQRLVQGRAYRLAFFTLVIYEVLYGLLEVRLQDMPVEKPLGQVAGLLIAAGSYMIYRVHYDAFFSRQQRPRIWIWSFGVMALVATFTSVHICHTYGFVREGKLSLLSLVPLLGAYYLALFLATSLQLWYEKRKGRRE